MEFFRPVALQYRACRFGQAILCILSLLIVSMGMSGCTGRQEHAAIIGNKSPMRPEELFQTNVDRMATLGMRNNLNGLYVLMSKLYRRNPGEWRKGGSLSVQAAEQRVQMAIEHGSALPELGGRRDVAALSFTLSSDYRGDRVGGFIYALGSMLVTAHGGRTKFYIDDTLDPQYISNAARNTEKAAWMLASRRDVNGAPWLLSNELSEQGNNLSFAVGFGKIVARLDLLVDVLDERYRRVGVNYAHNLMFINFLPVQ